MVGSLNYVQVALCLLALASSLTSIACIDASSVAQQNFQEDFQRTFESQLDLIENQNIGCLFDKDVCSLGDSCLDDGLFGTCIAAYSDVSFTYRLPPGVQQDLRDIMATLVALNYSWHDRYTQCCVRAALISASMEIPTDLAVCQEFAQLHRSPPSAVINVRQLLRRLLSQETKRAAEGDFDLMKRLELLNRKKYEYFLDIPEKKSEVKLRPQLPEAPRLRTAWLEAEDEAQDEASNEAAWSKIERMLDWDHLRRNADDEELGVHRDEEERAAESEPAGRQNWQSELQQGGDDRQMDGGSDGDSSGGVNILKEAIPPPEVWAIDSSSSGESPAGPDDEEPAAANQEEDDPPRRMAAEEKMKEDEQEDDDEEEKLQPPPPPPPTPPKRRQQQPQSVSSASSSVESLATQLSKRQANLAFIDGRFLWVQFVRKGSVAASEIASFISRLNSLAGKRLLGDRSSVNATNNEVYFELAPSAKPGDIQGLLENRTTADALKAGGRFAWTSYGFGRPQNRVGASELGGGNLSHDRARLTSTLLVCGLVLAMIGALFAVFLVQRMRSSKKKMRDIAGGGGGGSGSADYRDLCRQRMLQKSSEQREPVSAAAQQIAAARPAAGAAAVASDSPNSSTGSWSEDPITTDMDITTGHLILSYMEEYLSNKEKLEQEWTNLCTYEADQNASAAGAAAENAAKNRYQDLLPYDHSRVVLSKDQNATGSDYINASSISDSDPKVKSYILAQAPTEATAGDFWQMLWECGTVTVVNLTRMTSPDGARQLCSQYWPGEGSKLFNRFEVHLVSEHIWCEDFVVRNFYLKNLSTGEARTVTMFHFLAWEEDGLPPSAKALLDFRRKVNKSYKGRTSPLVVHCNDGSGRSGTYCLLDLALNRINKGVKEIDLAANLEHLRDQRAGLVKTKDQFEFVVTAIAEEVNNVLKTLPQ